MAILTIIQKKRRMMPILPHKILIGGKCIGLMRTPMIHINMPQGLYEITIQSLFPFIKTSAIVKVEEEVDNVMEFEDKEKYWDILFSFDMLLWIVSLFINCSTKLSPVCLFFHLLRRNFRTTLWSLMGKSVTDTASIKPSDSYPSFAWYSLFMRSSR